MTGGGSSFRLSRQSPMIGRPEPGDLPPAPTVWRAAAVAELAGRRALGEWVDSEAGEGSGRTARGRGVEAYLPDPIARPSPPQPPAGVFWGPVERSDNPGYVRLRRPISGDLPMMWARTTPIPQTEARGLSRLRPKLRAPC